MRKKRKLLYIMLIAYLAILVALLIIIFPAVSDAVLKDFFRYASAEVILTIFLVIIVCITAIIMAIVMVYNKDSKDNKDGEPRINVALNDERSYLERQISELNEKLVSTDERWREAYHLIMTSQNKQVDGNGVVSIEKFLEGFGIDVNQIKVQKDLAFVLVPFHMDYIQTYEIIKSTCIKAKMIAMKGDEEFVPKDVLQHIVKCIVKSRIVIANLDGRNPNVFYELGIAHALNKPTILIAHINTEVPFDLKNQYLVLYKNENELKERLFDVLLKVMTKSE